MPLTMTGAMDVINPGPFFATLALLGLLLLLAVAAAELWRWAHRRPRERTRR